MTGNHPRVLQPELTLPTHLCAPRQSGPSKGHPGGYKGDQESPSKCLAVIWVGAIRARSWGRQLTDSVLLCCACKGDSNGFRTDTEEPRVSRSRTATTTSKVIDDSSHAETAAFPASPHYPSSWVAGCKPIVAGCLPVHRQNTDINGRWEKTKSLASAIPEDTQHCSIYFSFYTHAYAHTHIRYPYPCMPGVLTRLPSM